MKIRIGICDDENIILQQLKEFTIDTFKEIGKGLEIQEFNSGEALINEYKVPFDILLLDIKLGGMNGIQTAKAIREFDDNVCIIFITGLSEYAKEGYKVKAYRYLTKPLYYTEFKAEVVQAVREIERFKNKYVILKNDRGVYRLNSEDIVLAERKDRKVIISTIDEDIESHNSLKYFENQLDSKLFSRCHQGYIVNLKYIKSITRNNIVQLQTGYELPLSKHRRKFFMQQLTNYLGDMI